MKKLLSIASLLILITTSCRKIEADNIIIGSPDHTEENVILEGKISSDRILKSNYVYKIRGFVYVVNGAKLTIEPGTVIVGERGSATRGSLIITKGSQLIADGTKERPIVFTSDQQTPQRGDWGGVVILGSAKTNASYNGVPGIGSVEGGVNTADGLGLYGGSNDDDNSGILRYVRIEYAGYAYLPDNELNGLTLAGVGRGTIIDHIEIYKANDDAIECFGGSVNMKHIVLISTLDDDFDTDNGWNGQVQFGIVMRDSLIADISKSESFESDNDANGSSTEPQTLGTYSNMTIIGPRATTSYIGNSLYLAGAQIRRNSGISIFNSVIMGYPTGLLIDASKGTPTDLNIQSGKLAFQHNIIAGCATPLSYFASTTAPTGWDIQAMMDWFNLPTSGNEIYAINNDLKLKDVFNYSDPNFTPMNNSPLLINADFTNSKLSSGSFFTPVTYRGAVGPNGADADWWKGWTKLNLN